MTESIFLLPLICSNGCGFGNGSRRSRRPRLRCRATRNRCAIDRSREYYADHVGCLAMPPSGFREVIAGHQERMLHRLPRLVGTEQSRPYQGSRAIVVKDTKLFSDCLKNYGPRAISLNPESILGFLN